MWSATGSRAPQTNAEFKTDLTRWIVKHPGVPFPSVKAIADSKMVHPLHQQSFDQAVDALPADHDPVTIEGRKNEQRYREAFMKANKAAAVKSGARVVEVRESIVSKVYDTQISSFSTDGAWDPESIDVIRKSLKDLGILDSIPEAKTIYNDKFVPVKI